MSGIQEDETAFPRGGHRAPPTSTVDVSKKRNSDFLFGTKPSAEQESSGKKKKKRRKSSTPSTTTSLLPVGGGGVVQPHSKKEALIETLSFGKLAKGTKLLGVVKEVHDDYVIVSLPNLLNGYILKRDKDPYSLTDSLQVHQVLAVVVVKVSTESIPGGGGGTRKRIQVSALPSGINPLQTKEKSIVRGRITSVEDHGCLVDLGHHQTGFLSFENIEGDYSLNSTSEDSNVRLLNPGRIHDFLVNKHSSTSKVIPLSLPSRETLAHKMVNAGEDYTLQTLNPGMLVQVRVEALARNGLCVLFGGNAFRGSIELSHLGALFLPKNKQQDGSTEWKNVFTSKLLQKFPARILAVDSITKVVRLTLLPHLLDMYVGEDESSFPPVGTVVENATVVRLDPGVGALLALPSLDDQDLSTSTKLWQPFSKSEAYSKASKHKTAYVHISKAFDGGRTPEAEFSKAFAPSTTHTIRILNTSHVLDGIATCATADSIVQAHVLTHADLEPGKVYRGVTVCGQLEGGSVMVDFGMDIRGIIPQMHLFDHSVQSEYRTRLMKEKYAVGSKVDVLCLSVDVPQKRCLVTAKKSLIKASSDCIAAYDTLEPGQTATGFVSKIDDKGLCVTFCNRVYGKVTARSLAAELGVEDHRADYHLGDVVQCRVIICKKRNNKNRDGGDQWDLNLSLNLQRGDGDADEEMEDALSSATSRQVELEAGAILPEKCMKVVEIANSIPKENGTFIPGHAIVRIKSKFLVKVDSAKVLPHVECKLPFDQLLDEYSDKDIESAESLDRIAKEMLTVGKKIDRKGLVLSDPKKSSDEYASGLGRLPLVSLRPKLIATAEELDKDENSYTSPLLPTEDTHLFMGAFVQGYVTQVNPKHGSFVRFLNRVTGLVPKVKKGLNLPKYGTVTCRIVALDVSSSPPKILLTLASAKDKKKKDTKDTKKELPPPPAATIKPGDIVKTVEVIDFDFSRARVKFDGMDKSVRARIHVTMADAPLLSSSIQSHGKKKKKNEKQPEDGNRKITKHHPFYKWKNGTKLSGLSCVAVDVRDGVSFVELSNRDLTEQAKGSSDSRTLPMFLESTSDLEPGMKLSGVITSVPRRNNGVWVQMSPGISGFIPALELSTDANVVNNIASYYPVGARIECVVMEKENWEKNKRRSHHGNVDNKSKKSDTDLMYLSLLQVNEMESSGSFSPITKPLRGDLIVGRVNRHTQQQRAPALMLDLRGGYVGRCCITELDEVDEWVNMPLGQIQATRDHAKRGDHVIVTDEEHDKMDVDGESDENESVVSSNSADTYPNGSYVQCRVLAGIPSEPVVEVSLRPSRIEGDLDDDELPSEKDMVQGYVVDTNKKGCFVRLSRQTEGRVILKELCDGFLHDPVASFPMGRLVVGKVKSIQEQNLAKKKKKTKGFVKATVDLDMRESTLLESQDKLEFDDIELQTKHKAVVTRIESYGVFVRLENSSVSGLCHKSECSDKYIKNLADLYDPGDLVKVLVVKKDSEGRKLGFSMKASHFEDDEDSDDESLDDGDDSDSDEEMADVLVSDEADDTGDELDSDDENFASKLAAKMEAEETKDGGDSDDDSNDGSDDEGSSDGSSSDDDSESEDANAKPSLDTNVGFEWGNTSAEKTMDESSDESSDDSSDDDDDSDGPGKTSHKSKRKAAARRREEQEISRREAALADGTADENPETAADFERLLASEPNRSEHWIRYMAYHLSLADIASARNVAQRAFDRIEFRQEGEKLNVWTALLTLELKYGAPKSFQEAIDKACQHNNPKQLYLRVCEILEKEVDNAPSSAEAVTRADAMYKKMCKKFKSKKTVWLQHLHYLLKGGRHQEAHALLKRALTSLPEYKHIETMSKFAQLEMELGSMERGRTIMDGLLSKYPKRLDLLFVYVDKEVKHGELDAARALFEREHKFSDKQMKSLFKKWYRVEEEHGTDDSREHVKDAARAYVERSNK